MMKLKRNMSIDYFRAFLMLLVVWHHATLAYSTTGSGVLIADHNTFVLFDLIALYNDFFFMFAFFFISGLFSYKALIKKGSKLYLEERLIRLLLPFAFGTLLINPIAHYFRFLKEENASFSIGSYFHFLFENFGRTEANHLWFLWVLFLFSLVLVLYDQCKKVFRIPIQFNQESFVLKGKFFTLDMIFAGMVLYLPLRNVAEGGFVTLMEPFNMQVSRILLYLIYFIAGNVVGSYGIEKSFFFQVKFQKKWWLWITLSIIFTVINIVIHVIREPMGAGAFKSFVFIVEQGMVVVISLCALFGFISFFTLHVEGKNPVMNVLAREAMGIYVIHYSVVTVIQYLFTFIDISAAMKGISVVFLALLISISLIILLNKIPVIGTVFGGTYNSKHRRGYIAFTLVMLLILIVL